MNVARGGVIYEDVLVWALDAGIVARVQTLILLHSSVSVAHHCNASPVSSLYAYSACQTLILNHALVRDRDMSRHLTDMTYKPAQPDRLCYDHYLNTSRMACVAQGLYIILESRNANIVDIRL
jgi:hypothetical protein